MGGGATGCELGQALRRPGSQVTVIEAAPRLLPVAGPRASKVIGQVLPADGAAVRAGTAVEKIEIKPNGGGCLLHLPGSAAVAADRLLVAAAHGVYAAADCTALMPFTHAAYAMGRIAARNALRQQRTGS